ncbi:unnamed protein product, partial [Clavelina lepadiformis]
MVPLKSFGMDRKVPKFTKLRQILKEDFLLFTMVPLEIVRYGPESSEIHKNCDRFLKKISSSSRWSPIEIASVWTGKFRNSQNCD